MLALPPWFNCHGDNKEASCGQGVRLDAGLGLSSRPRQVLKTRRTRVSALLTAAGVSLPFLLERGGERGRERRKRKRGEEEEERGRRRKRGGGREGEEGRGGREGEEEEERGRKRGRGIEGEEEDERGRKRGVRPIDYG